MYLSEDVTNCRKTTKKTISEQKPNRTVAPLLSSSVFCVALFKCLLYFCLLSSTLKETVPESRNLDKPPSNQHVPGKKKKRKKISSCLHREICSISLLLKDIFNIPPVSTGHTILMCCMRLLLVGIAICVKTGKYLNAIQRHALISTPQK